MHLRNTKPFNFALLLLVFISLMSACSRQGMSERDKRREQTRINNEIKKRELAKVGGRYLGVLKSANSNSAQRVILELDVKELPESSQDNSSPDAILTPKLSGAVRFDYGEDASGQKETVVFGLTQSEFDNAANRLNLVSNNEDFKDLLFSLTSEGDGLAGNWTSPQSSMSGEAKFVRIGSERTHELDLAPVSTIKGEYPGFLTLSQSGQNFRVALVLNTQPLPPDRMRLSGVFKIFSGDNELFYSYPFDQAEFNPISGQFVVKNEALSLFGSENGGEFSGELSLAHFGKLGTFVVSRKPLPQQPTTTAAIYPQSGTFLGKLNSQSASFKLPENVALNLMTVRDPSVHGGLRLSGNLRLYLGSYQGTEYIESPLSEVTFNPFTNEFVAGTNQTLAMTVKGSFGSDSIQVKLISDATGVLSDGTLRRGDLATYPSARRDIQGEYLGYLKIPRDKLYFRSKMLVTSRQVAGQGLVFSVSVLAYMGDVGSQDYLTYHFNDVAPSLQTNELVLKRDGVDAYFKISLSSFPQITGQWGSSYVGDTGQIVFASNTLPPIEDNTWKSVESVRGTFRGRLTDTHPSTNLPSRFELGLVTSRIENESGGEIRVSGSMRFYLGDFGSTEYSDAALRDIQYNFFTREFSGQSDNDGGYVLKGRFDGRKFVGKLYHKTLGEVADIELEKVTP